MHTMIIIYTVSDAYKVTKKKKHNKSEVIKTKTKSKKKIIGK